MAAEAKVREMFDAIDTSGDGFISSSELGTAFRRMGMNPTRSDVVLALRELDANGDGRVSFAEFVRYYKRFSERYGGSKFNRLLVKDLVGHTRKSGYDLPPEGHAYGKKVRADPEGAGQVVLHWKSGSPSKARRPARDLVAMNARAAASGCTTAAEIRAFHRGNVAYQKTFKPAKREMAAVDVVYGQKNRCAALAAGGGRRRNAHLVAMIAGRPGPPRPAPPASRQTLHPDRRAHPGQVRPDGRGGGRLPAADGGGGASRAREGGGRAARARWLGRGRQRQHWHRRRRRRGWQRWRPWR